MNSNMKFLESLGRNIKNIFVGSHRDEDFILENLEKTDKQSEKAEENPRPKRKLLMIGFLQLENIYLRMDLLVGKIQHLLNMNLQMKKLLCMRKCTGLQLLDIILLV